VARFAGMTGDLAIGITAASRPDHPRLGAELERLGYGELWVNDTRRGDGVATLAEILPGTSSLRLGLGVVALSEHPAATIPDRLSSAGLPLARLTLGVGSGASASLELVRSGVTELRSLLPDIPIAISAVGPRMLRLGGEVADAVVATWALPARLSWIRERIVEGAEAAGRRPPRLVVYVRMTVGRDAAQRLRAEMERYAAYGPHYARAFAAQPDALIGVAVQSADSAAVAAELASYRSVADTVVLRAIPTDDSVDAWIDLARLAAPGSAAAARAPDAPG
jgi:alkanesulfonate monooxygenase SsuD/methylene tetrahydromethanopterin reductase-like flavin-dependent oxidoreductase (luciferase family)